MKTYNDVEQLSELWMALRVGSIGGSSISSVVAGGQGKMRKNLLYRLAGEILSGQKYEGYHNDHMDRGIEQESEARSMYELMTNQEVIQVGLIKESDHKHVSPDGLVDPDGMIEIKCTIPSVHIETIIMDRVPPEYWKQCQWGMFVAKRNWLDFISYSPLVIDRPIWIKRIECDEKTVIELDDGSDKFIAEMLEIVEKIKGK